MKISTRGRYALRLMADLATADGPGYVSLKDVAERQDISMKYLEQIVSGLAKAELLDSTRGPKGGYRLVKPAKEYNAMEILQAVEGNLAPVDCLNCGYDCNRQVNCTMRGFWGGLHEVVQSYCESITLQQLVDDGAARRDRVMWDLSLEHKLTGNW